MLNKALTIVLILIIIWLQYQIWYGEKAQGDQEGTSIALLQAQIKEQVEQNKQLSLQNEKLKKEIWLLRNNLETLEEKAREQLGLIKEGEIFYRIIPREN